jgi:type 1 glutamine amidotransferase
MRWMRMVCGAVATSTALLAGAAQAQEKSADAPPPSAGRVTNVVFVTGDDEYGSELSMPMMALILANHHGMTCTVLYAENEKGERDPHGNSIQGLQSLRNADVAVFFMRYRALPQDQLDEITRYAESGKPMIGFRTTTHAFKYPGPPNDKWNDGFGRNYFGQKWISHYGHGNSTEAHIVDAQAKHPILRGVDRDMWLHSWLYVMNQDQDKLPKDCVVLIEGDATKGTEKGGEKFGERQPLAWTRELPAKGGGKQRIFYTSLGHPRDFTMEGPRRLLVNAVYWALGREKEIPAGGAKVDVIGEYNPPDPH